MAAEFEKLMGQYSNASETLEQQRAASRDAKQKAEQTHKELKKARKKFLEEKLNAAGLGVCTHGQHWWANNTGPESIGIYPKDQLRLLYSSVETWRGSEYTEHIVKEPELELLCPDHFPELPNQVWPQKEWRNPDPKDPNITSEVVEQNGKLVTLVNSIEVKLELRRRGYSDEVYRHFQIPDLPADPWKPF